MKEFWNDRYATGEYFYGKEPNAFFKDMVDGLAPGKILLPAEGEGRNAVYAATKGWDVKAFDISEEGRKKALKLAADNNVQISYSIASAEDFELSKEKYDAVGLIYSHMIPSIRQTFHKELIECLKKGGTIFLEAFNKKQINRNSGGPKNLDMLYDIDTIKDDFSVLDIDFLEEYEIEINESEAHSGVAEIIRFIARKK